MGENEAKDDVIKELLRPVVLELVQNAVDVVKVVSEREQNSIVSAVKEELHGRNFGDYLRSMLRDIVSHEIRGMHSKYPMQSTYQEEELKRRWVRAQEEKQQMTSPQSIIKQWDKFSV